MRAAAPLLRRRLSSGGAMADWAIDVHTHIYYPRYMELMRSRAASGSVPYVKSVDGQDRLVILPDEDQESSTAAGRPIGAEYSSIAEKIAFMDRHEIAVSVLSLAVRNTDSRALSLSLSLSLSLRARARMPLSCGDTSNPRRDV